MCAREVEIHFFILLHVIWTSGLGIMGEKPNFFTLDFWRFFLTLACHTGRLRSSELYSTGGEKGIYPLTDHHV